jgi:hypothetical protein
MRLIYIEWMTIRLNNSIDTGSSHFSYVAGRSSIYEATYTPIRPAWMTGDDVT